MKRRDFIKGAALALPAVAALSKLPFSENNVSPKLPTKFNGFEIAPTLPKKFHGFDVLEDGTLSLRGQTHFAVYGPLGGPVQRTLTYRLLADGSVQATELTLLDEFVRRGA